MTWMIQRVGDRDKTAWSIKDYAFSVVSNPMSDRVQMVLESYEQGKESVERADRSRVVF